MLVMLNGIGWMFTIAVLTLLENRTCLKVEHWHLYHVGYPIGFLHQNRSFLYYLQLIDHLHVLELQCWCEEMWGWSPKWMLCWFNPSFPHRWHHPLPSPLWQAHLATFVAGMQPLLLLTLTLAFENPYYPISLPWVVGISFSYNFHSDRGKKYTPWSLTTSHCIP
jgi:hypothetical protein